MENNKLYNNIITGISKSLKDVLDETLTTHPFNKIRNYLDKIKEQYDINIYVDKKNDINPYYKIAFKYDDIQLTVCSNISNDSLLHIKEELTKKFEYVGYMYLKSFSEDNKLYFIFTPNKQNIINMNEIDDNYLFHICPTSVIHKIKAQGFCPYSKNKIFSYDPRIHFCFNNTPLPELRLLRTQLEYGRYGTFNKHDYSLIILDKTKIKDTIVFYKDLDYNYGIYTKQNLESNIIVDVLPIYAIDNSEYISEKFKNNINKIW